MRFPWPVWLLWALLWVVCVFMLVAATTTRLAPVSPPSGAARATVYLIRHGEKPDTGNGLSAEGHQRAQCLRTVFGESSNYRIGYIMAQTPKKNGKRTRPLDTVQPLATDLGLAVDTSCDRDDQACVVDVINNYRGPGNILLCWEHAELTDIVKEMGVKKSKSYPPGKFNLIWTIPYDYSRIASITSERCPGLDL